METKSLAELKAADLPHATCESVGMGIKALDTDEHRATVAQMVNEIDKYLQSFTPGPKCPKCNAELGGLLGSFTWRITTGEGFCGCCRYPVRGHHQLPGCEGILPALLPYHPSILESVPELAEA